MVKINDLRIGNWVDYDGKGLKIECLYSKGWINDLIVIDEKTKLAITESTIDPIPITKEIVEKICFKKVEENLYEYEMQRRLPFSEKLLVRIKDDEDYENWASVKHPVSGWEIGVATSFHQLQNLFYAITGEELIGPYGLIKKHNNTWIICHKEDL